MKADVAVLSEIGDYARYRVTGTAPPLPPPDTRPSRALPQKGPAVPDWVCASLDGNVLEPDTASVRPPYFTDRLL